MKFFVPFTVGRLQAQQSYDHSKKRLKDIGLQVSEVCIQQIAFHYGRELVNQQVGDTALNGEIIGFILHSDVGYFVCTFTTARPTEPIPIRYALLIMDSSVVSVRYFDY